MIKLRQAVVVEGKYDKIKLAGLLDTTIIETGGFRIFKDKDKAALLRALAKTVGLVIFTDSDAAGFAIRGHIKGCVEGGKIYNAYIPEILGKEKRKSAPSKAGTLGVEGVPDAIITAALEKAGVYAEKAHGGGKHITKTDLFEDGLSGSENSRALRLELLKLLELPQYLSANSMLEVLNTLYSPDEYKSLVGRLREREQKP
ncbi:MAG: DUF4093 domain-containing protein [Hydrogenoanaerobacterium sp.]